MQVRRWIGVLLLGAAVCTGQASATLSVEERAPLVELRATKLRQALLQQQRSPAQIEADYERALSAAERAWAQGQPDEALAALGGLQAYAPLAELPFVKAQLLMAAIAQSQRNQELRNHHRAWALALVKAIGASGDGRSTATAFRLVQRSEVQAWLLAHKDRYQPLDQQSYAEGERHYEVWRAQPVGGGEIKLYFDVSAALRDTAAQPQAKPAARPSTRAQRLAQAKKRTRAVQKNQSGGSAALG